MILSSAAKSSPNISDVGKRVYGNRSYTWTLEKTRGDKVFENNYDEPTSDAGVSCLHTTMGDYP